MQARILQAEAKLLLHEPEGARELIGEYADRPYKIEGDRDDISRLMRLDCQARARRRRSTGSADCRSIARWR